MDLQKIEELCHNVCKDVKQGSSESFSSSKALRTLRHLCGKCNCPLGSFSPYQNFQLLLKLNGDKVINDYNVGISIITNFNMFAHLEHCMVVLENIVKSALTANKSELRNSFLKLVWNHPGLKRLSPVVIEEFVIQETKYLEEDLLNLFTHSLENPHKTFNFEEHRRYTLIISWCSTSAKLFAIVTSVLNVLLIKVVNKTQQFSLCAHIVESFIGDIRLECTKSKTDFVLLYPREFHSLVTFLSISPNLFTGKTENCLGVTLETITTLIKQSMALKPSQTFFLLTHFPKWVQLIHS